MITTPINKILFLDIETVGIEKNYLDCRTNRPELAKQFDKYMDWFLKRFPEDGAAEDPRDLIFKTRTALVPEFAKIVCVSVAFINDKGESKFQTFYGDDEETLLKDCQKMLIKCGTLNYFLCGHNLKNFDIPMLAKRMIVNGIKPPSILPSYDTKPWDVKAIDTKEVWQYGAYSSIGSLDLLCASLGVPSPKEGEVTGATVHDCYWNKNMLIQIAEYCERDVQVLIDIIKKLKQLL